jgi:hypothetical protein
MQEAQPSVVTPSATAVAQQGNARPGFDYEACQELMRGGSKTLLRRVCCRHVCAGQPLRCTLFAAWPMTQLISAMTAPPRWPHSMNA